MDATFLGMSGFGWAVLGAAFAAALSGIGSTIGITIAAVTASGVLSEDDSLFGQVLPLVAMPSTQGIYGFITAVLVAVFFGVMGGNTDISLLVGLGIFAAVQPVAWLGLFTGIYQGHMCAGGIRIIGAGKKVPALVFPALTETYVILGLIASILILLGLQSAAGM
ncbi:MAG: permease [Coriobacteriia bacterium]|nr:permease [Coriobacteriia bacterium]